MKSKRIQGFIKKSESLRNYVKIIFPESSRKLRFLDLSCGKRKDIQEVVESFGHEWVGVDIIDYPGVIKADAHHLPFGDAQFDIVFTGATFEHYHNPWQVAKEVQRVSKPNGYFCGLIAFIQPMHGNSYYHFTHLGVQQMLKETNFKVMDIHTGDIHGVTYLVNTMFSLPFPFIGKFLSFYSKLLVLFRRVMFPLIIKIIYVNNKFEKEKKLKFLKGDKLRYAASIIFLAQKLPL